MPISTELQLTFLYDKWVGRFVEKILKGFAPRARASTLQASPSEVLNESPLFDKEWYLNQYPDVAQSDMDPVEHYLQFGADEGRKPSENFDTLFYCREYPDVLNSRINPLYHYLIRGRTEGRLAINREIQDFQEIYRVLNATPLFSREWYLSKYPDVALAGVDPVAHYIQSGASEGRNPSAEFSTNFYLTAYPDVFDADLNPLYHYIQHGRKEGRVTQPGFRVAENFDAAASEAWVTQLRADPASARILSAAPLVSIILPTRNRIHVLLNAIESVLSQTYANWELLVIDDGSTDGSAEVVKNRFGDSRIKLFQVAHAGVCEGRNRGLREAAGEFIAYIDSDNTWTPEYLELMLCEMARSGADSAYAILKCIEELPDGQESSFFFRQKPFDYESLKLTNFIDLNVFIHRKHLLQKCGGFDVRLKRMVDWDLVLRYTRGNAPSFAKFIGALYDNGPAQDRISNREAHSWVNVVRNRCWIDWESQIEALPTRDPHIVSIVICIYQQINLTEACLKSLFTHQAGEAFELILVDNGSTPSTHQRLRMWEERYPECIRLIKNPENFNFALGNNIGFAASRGSRVVFLNNDTEVLPEWLRTLVRPLRDPKVKGTQPKLLFPNGTIQNVGLVFPKHSPMAYPIYRNNPGDFLPTQKPRNYAAVTAACLALRADDFARARGFDPVFTNGQEDVDLCLRIGAGKPVFRYVPDSIVLHHEGQTANRGGNIQLNRKIFYKRWRNYIRPDDHDYYSSDEVCVESYVPDNEDWASLGYAVWAPLIHDLRSGPTVDSWADQRTIAIKIGCPRPSMKDHWGDYHFAVALASAFARKGMRSRIDFYESWQTVSAKGDINLVLRGLSRFSPDPDTLNLMWLISHPDCVSVEEMKVYDHVFVASSIWANELSRSTNLPLETLFQCTDASRFDSDGFDESAQTDLLFVANSRKILRPVIREAVAQNLPINIYGEMWGGLAPEPWVKATQIDNVDLPRYYASANVVLNDHWDHMRENGFVSNRIFDVLACGAPVVSDSVAGLPPELAEGCHFFDQGTPLAAVVEKARRDPRKLSHQAKKLAQYVRLHHSFDARASRILDVIKSLLNVHAALFLLDTCIDCVDAFVI